MGSKKKMINKRSGCKMVFKKTKVRDAVLKAFTEVDNKITDYAKHKSDEIANVVAKHVETSKKNLSVEEIQDIVVNMLMRSRRRDVAVAYIEYRYKRKLVRESNTTDNTILNLIRGDDEYWKTENSNKNSNEVTVQRDYIAGATSTDISRRLLLPQDIVDAHDNGIIHFHDMDYYAQSVLSNCSLCNLEDMLQNGTVINKTMIEKPHRFITAMTIATQIITAVTSSQYGGVSMTLTHLAPFVRSSYEIRYNEYRDRGLSERMAKIFAEKDLKKEIEDGVQTFNYQCNSMSTTNGQSPFLTVFMYLGETDEYKYELSLIIEEFLKQRIIGIKNEVGRYITPAFPKLIYVLEEDNIHDDSEYWYLTELSAKCTAKRMVPDYISEKIMKKLKVDSTGRGNCYPVMGCRSALTPYIDKEGNPEYYGRLNLGVVTVSLPDIALSSGGDEDKFWKIFEERTELCHKALRCRYERFIGVKSDVAPIMWQYGALGRLKKGEDITHAIDNGRATISLGYAGLYECVKYMTGKSHTTIEGKGFALRVMRKLNEKTSQWRDAENLAYSLYGTPIESTTYKFANSLKKRFGDDVFVKLDGKDRSYITNSYHIPVFERIDPFEKIRIESEFQELSPGGAISYIECADMQKNIPAVLSVIQFIYENIMYAELNTKSDYCHKCGYDGEIKIIDDDGKLIWECPNCKNRDQNTMNVTRRTCGYIGTNYWNPGRTEEISDRFEHLTDIEA